MLHLLFYNWFISLSIMFSGFIRIVIYGRIFSCLKINNIPLCVYAILFNPFIYWWTHVGCFHNLAIVNNDALNMKIQTSLWDSDFSYFGCVFRNGIVGLHGIPIFSWETSLLFSLVATSFTIPTKGTQRFQFLHLLTNSCYLLLFEVNPDSCCQPIFDKCVKKNQWGKDSVFKKWCWIKWILI